MGCPPVPVSPRASGTRRSAALDPRAWVAGQSSGWRAIPRCSRVSSTAAAWTDSSPRTASGGGWADCPTRSATTTIAIFRSPGTSPTGTCCSTGSSRRRGEAASGTTCSPSLRRPATPARTSCRRRAIRPRPRSSTGSRLRASRGASTSRTTTRRTRSPTPSWASGLPSCSRCHCWRCRACCVRHGSRRISSICRSSTAMRRPDGFPRSRTSRLAASTSTRRRSSSPGRHSCARSSTSSCGAPNGAAPPSC